MALVDAGVECSLIHGNPERQPRVRVAIDVKGGNKKSPALFGYRSLPSSTYEVFISPTPENMIRMDKHLG